jgi:predicted transcriptional regulator YdeE
MTVKIVERPALIVVGLHLRTKPMSEDIKAMWPKFVARIGEIQNKTEPGVTYGVMRHEEATFESFDYMAAVAVSNAHIIPDGLTRATVPGGTYAAFTFPISGLQKGFHEIFNHLLPGSGYVQTPGPYYERYGETFDIADSNSPVEIYLPVKR